MRPTSVDAADRQVEHGPRGEMESGDNALVMELEALRARDTLSDEALAGMFSEVAGATVDKRPTARDRLRELPTRARVGLAVVGAVVVSGMALATMGMRGDLTGQALLRYGVAMVAVAGLVATAFAVSLRGLHQRPLGRGAWAVIALLLAVPLVLAVTPSLWETPAPAVGQAAGHIPCLILGVLTGALTAAVAWVFQRQDLAVVWRLVAAATGGGLTAFAMLQLHCPSQRVDHLVIAHAGAGLLLAGVAAVAAWLRRRVS